MGKNKAETLNKYYSFLREARKHGSSPKGIRFKQLSNIANSAKISNNAIKVCVELGFIKKIEYGFYKFNLTKVDLQAARKLIACVNIRANKKSITQAQQQLQPLIESKSSKELSFLWGAFKMKY